MRWRTLLAIQRGPIEGLAAHRAAQPDLIPWAAIRDARFTARTRFSPEGRLARAPRTLPLPEALRQATADPAP